MPIFPLFTCFSFNRRIGFNTWYCLLCEHYTILCFVDVVFFLYGIMETIIRTDPGVKVGNFRVRIFDVPGNLSPPRDPYSEIET